MRQSLRARFALTSLVGNALVFVGCDLTRTRPGQANPAPQTLPGLPAKTC